MQDKETRLAYIKVFNSKDSTFFERRELEEKLGIVGWINFGITYSGGWPFPVEDLNGQ